MAMNIIFECKKREDKKKEEKRLKEFKVHKYVNACTVHGMREQQQKMSLFGACDIPKLCAFNILKRDCTQGRTHTHESEQMYAMPAVKI